MNILQHILSYYVLEDKIVAYAEQLYRDIYGEDGDYSHFYIDDDGDGDHIITAYFMDGLDYVQFSYEDL